jgi:hypothetical protein
MPGGTIQKCSARLKRYRWEDNRNNNHMNGVKENVSTKIIWILFKKKMCLWEKHHSFPLGSCLSLSLRTAPPTTVHCTCTTTKEKWWSPGLAKAKIPLQASYSSSPSFQDFGWRPCARRRLRAFFTVPDRSSACSKLDPSTVHKSPPVTNSATAAAACFPCHTLTSSHHAAMSLSPFVEVAAIFSALLSSSLQSTCCTLSSYGWTIRPIEEYNQDFWVDLLLALQIREQGVWQIQNIWRGRIIFFLLSPLLFFFLLLFSFFLFPSVYSSNCHEVLKGAPIDSPHVGSAPEGKCPLIIRHNEHRVFSNTLFQQTQQSHFFFASSKINQRDTSDQK